MDQAHSLRKMVYKNHRLIFVLTCAYYKDADAFCKKLARRLDRAVFIDTTSVEDAKTFIAKTEYEYYIFAAKEVNFVEQFANHNIDVIVLTDSSSESVLGTYSQIKLLLVRNIFNARKNRIKLVAGPVETKTEAEKTLSNISATVRNYLKYELELLGWFYDMKNGIGDIGYRYLESGGVHVEN
ncbi:MAG: MinD/ParA family protein [Clostridiaceae bacterium]|nr:MinD/ParA family protein [Clostridiaceae bacterium]